MTLHPKLKKIESILSEIICILAGVVLLLVAIGGIPAILDVTDMWHNSFHTIFFDKMEPFIVVGAITMLALLLPVAILSMHNPSREELVDEQLRLIGQKTSEIERRLADNETQVALMEDQLRATLPSPLCHATEEQQLRIVQKLQVIAKPQDGTNKLNRAATAQFLRALQLKGFIDSAEKPNTLRLWVEQVTGYRDADKGHFAEAYKRVGEHSGDVETYMQEL